MTEPVAKSPPQQPRELNRSLLDRFFFAIATYGWNEREIASYPSSLRELNAQITDGYIAAFGQIDTKATGLLTHVSLMIAGLGLVAPLVANDHIEVGVVIAEIAVYLLIAVGCLRCLSIFHWFEYSDQPDAVKKLANHELILRRELYSLCIRSAIVLTIAVFLLLPVLYFWTPEK